MSPQDLLNNALFVKDLLDGMSIGEFELASRFPEDYDKNINGIKRIVVKDEDKEYRYAVIDGQLISQGKF